MKGLSKNEGGVMVGEDWDGGCGGSGVGGMVVKHESGSGVEYNHVTY